MKWLLLVLVILLSYLQYRLWIGDGSLAHAHRLENEIKLQQAEIDRMRERNRILDVELDLGTVKRAVSRRDDKVHT